MEFTNEILEKCAEAVHKAYCNYHLRNKGTEYWTKGDYSLLDEPTKQIDRETVKAVFATIKANPVENRVMQKIVEIVEDMKKQIWSSLAEYLQYEGTRTTNTRIEVLNLMAQNECKICDDLLAKIKSNFTA